jgi:hypothetical protein
MTLESSVIFVHDAGDANGMDHVWCVLILASLVAMGAQAEALGEKDNV